MEKNEKIMLGLGIAVTAGLIGWAIYAGSKKTVDEIVASGDVPPSGAIKNPNGTVTVTKEDGTKTTYTPKENQIGGGRSGANKGANGNWSNTTGFTC